MTRRVTVKFSYFLFFFLSSSSLAAFSLLFFPHPSSFFFLAFSPFPFPLLFSSLLSPSLELSVLSLELTALYWLSKHYFMPVQLITMKHQSKGSIFPGKCFQQIPGSLHVACVCSIASTSVQEVLSDSSTRPHVALCCMLKPQQIPGFLAAFFLYWIVSAGNAAQEVKWLSEPLLAVTFFNYSLLH